MEKHKLIIDCLYDAQAHCSCDKWHMACTGERTRREIEEEYIKHVSYLSLNDRLSLPARVFVEVDKLLTQQKGGIKCL